MIRLVAIMFLLFAATCTAGCDAPEEGRDETEASVSADSLLSKYTTVRLDADLSGLTDAQRGMIRHLIEAAQVIDSIYWDQSYGSRDSLMTTISEPARRRFAEINYGPWDRLDGNEPFIPGAGPKPAGANFYPAEMTKSEFEEAAASNEALRSL